MRIKSIARDFSPEVERRCGLVKKAAGFHVLGGLQRKTPVDTGRARASWNIAVHAADLSVARAGENVPIPAPPVLGEIPAGAPVIVSNNLPYIVPLNEGHSAQAPAQFVQLQVQETRAWLDPTVAEIKRQGERGVL